MKGNTMETPSRPMPHPSRSIRPAAADEKTTGAQARPAIDSHSLFAHSNTVVIRHGDTDYCLRITSLNKLILTK